MRLDFKPSVSSIDRRVFTAEGLASALAVLLEPSASSLAAPGSVDYDQWSAQYDNLDGGTLAEMTGIVELRRLIVGAARGATLEVAIGTGLNLPFYRPERLTSLDGVDLSDGMLAECQKRQRTNEGWWSSGTPVVSLTRMDVSQLHFPDGSFDTVLDTFSLCVFPDPGAALREMARVCKPRDQGGRVLLLEHNRADGVLGLYQDLTAKPIASLGKGCFWNQRVELLAESSGLEVLRAREVLGGTVILIEAARRS